MARASERCVPNGSRRGRSEWKSLENQPLFSPRNCRDSGIAATAIASICVAQYVA
jgi:hypothetical protein